MAITNGDAPSRKSRLILGLKLVSSVLQLNTTRWLTEVWEARDIYFPQADLKNSGHHILSRPFVRQNFNTAPYPDPLQQLQNQAGSVIGRNKSLYSLGIVLLEIWHWQTFSTLHSSSVSGQTQQEIFFAYELSEKLFDDAGERYSIAVQRCIRGLDIRGTDLEEDSFRKKVYQDIMGPLEANLKAFSGSDCIQDIIGEESEVVVCNLAE